MKRLILCSALLGCTTALWGVKDKEKKKITDLIAAYRRLLQKQDDAEKLIRIAEMCPENRRNALEVAYKTYETSSYAAETFLFAHPELVNYVTYGDKADEFSRTCTPEPKPTSSFLCSRASSPAVPT